MKNQNLLRRVKMIKTKRSLYQCSEPKVMGGRIKCAKGHILSSSSLDGSVNIEKLVRGTPLVYKVCQECAEYDEMGPPVLKEDRGWAKL